MYRNTSHRGTGSGTTPQGGLDTKSVLHETRVVKNVTVTLDEETARWARVEAARRDVSLSSLLRDLLREHMGGRESYSGAKDRYLSREPQKLGGPRPSREELHDRAGLR
jgi:hypothetical protein